MRITKFFRGARTDQISVSSHIDVLIDRQRSHLAVPIDIKIPATKPT